MRTVSPSSPPPARRAWGLAVLVLSVALAASLLLRHLASADRPLVAWEPLVHLVLLGSLLTIPRVRRFVAESPPLAGVPILGLVVLLYVGQFAGMSRTTFPFVVWDIYGDADRRELSRHFRVEGRTPTGETFEIRPAELIPSVANSSVIDQLHRRSVRGDPGPLDALLARYGALADRSDRSRSVAAVVLRVCEYRVFPRDERSESPRCRIVREVDPGGAG